MKKKYSSEIEAIIAADPDLQRFREIHDRELGPTETLVEQLLVAVDIYMRDSGYESLSRASGKVDWMSVDERLPSEDGYYWCYLAECPPQSYPQQSIRWRDGHWLTSWVVSHWRPLMPVPVTGVSR